MELRQYIFVIRKWFWLLLLSVTIAAASAFLAGRAATPLYRTATTLMVGRLTQDPDPTSAGLQAGQQLAHTYARLALRRPVLQGALQALDLPWDWASLVPRVTAAVVPQTQLLEIAVVDSDPGRAKALADAIAQQLVLQGPPEPEQVDPEQARFTRSQLADLKTKIESAQAETLRLERELEAANSARSLQELQGQVGLLETKIGAWQATYAQLLAGSQKGAVNALGVVEAAPLPARPIRPDVPLNVLLAACLGLVLGLAGAFLLEYLDDTLRCAADITRIAPLPILGEPGPLQAAEGLVALHDPRSPQAGAFRLLRLNLQAALPAAPPQALLITSPGPGEGESAFLANLAVVMAQAGQSAILVDADLRRPSLHRFFGLHNRYGLGDAILQAGAGLCDYLQESAVPNLRLLAGGPPVSSLPPDAGPDELLGAAGMHALIDALRAESDVVLFGAPPCLYSAGPALLGSRLDGVILLAAVGRTRLEDARRAVEQFTRLRIPLLGVVLSRPAARGVFRFPAIIRNWRAWKDRFRAGLRRAA